MAQTVLHKRSATTTSIPTTVQLSLGEIAINTWDGKMFIKKNDGTDAIVEVGAASAVTMNDVYAAAIALGGD